MRVQLRDRSFSFGAASRANELRGKSTEKSDGSFIEFKKLNGHLTQRRIPA